MSDRLPPLTALRAFDAAARHMSFAKAAAELNVTPAALSFQIKSLEEHLGHALFHRLNRAVELTEAGKALAPGAADGFDMLTRAWRNARQVHDASRLTITAGPAITAKWLAPRMFDFASKHPDIELRFIASLRLMDLARDDVDIAIRFGYPRGEEGYFSQTFLTEWVTPMATPALAAKIKKPEDLLNHSLLHDNTLDFLDPRVDWAEWFRIAGIDANPSLGSAFSQADHAIDAAEAGAGVVLGRISLTSRAIAEGTLAAPLPLAVSTEAQYRILCLKGAENRPHVRAFLDWLDEELRVTTEIGDDFALYPAGGPAAA